MTMSIESKLRDRVDKYLAEEGLVAVPLELLNELQALVIECRDEQPMDSDTLDALNNRIEAAQERTNGQP